MYYVYVLKSLIKDFVYVGYSTDIKQRLEYYQNGFVGSTKAYRPFELVFYEAHKSIVDAKRRENYLKTDKGKSTLRMMLRESLK